MTKIHFFLSGNDTKLICTFLFFTVKDDPGSIFKPLNGKRFYINFNQFFMIELNLDVT